MIDIRIIFIGDSFINGTGDPEFLGWTGRICQNTQLNNKNVELTSYNLGIRRETSSDILKRWESEASSRVVNGDKSIAVFSFGVNDCVVIDGKQRVDFETSKQNLEKILSKAKEKYDNVLFVVPPPIADDEINSRIYKLAGLYIDVCNTQEVEFINIFDQLKNDSIWQKETNENDGAHPKSKGYELFANLILEDKKWKKLWKF